MSHAKQHEVTFTTPGKHGFQKVYCASCQEVRAAVVAAALSILLNADRAGVGHIKWTDTATGQSPDKHWPVATSRKVPDIRVDVGEIMATANRAPDESAQEMAEGMVDQLSGRGKA